MAWMVRTWLPIAIAVSGVCFLVYIVALQQYRSSLDDPQLGIALDAAAQINAGAKIQGVVPKQPVDITESLATWIAIFDAEGKPLYSSGTFLNATPTPPIAEITVVKTDPSYSGQNRVRWQPYSGLRQALVVIDTEKDYIVVAGRNMREAEERIWNMQTTVGLGWLLILALTLVAARFGAGERNFLQGGSA